MLQHTRNAFNSDFMEKVKGGLLFVFDESKGITHLGWIEEATVERDRVAFKLGLSVMQQHGTTEWSVLDSHAFEVINIDNFTALENCGGFLCSDAAMQQPTFRVYPASAIPEDYARTHEKLIEYGNILK